MADQTDERTPESTNVTALAEIREALTDPNVNIRLPLTFTHGRGVQVYIKSRKIGPVLLRSEDQTLADLLHMLGTMAEETKA